MSGPRRSAARIVVVNMGKTQTSPFTPWATLMALPLVAVAALLLLVNGVTFSSVAVAALALAPIGLYLALQWPIESIFALYVLLVPFDNLLGAGSFGTITKLLGMVSGAFLLLWLVRRERLSLQSSPLRILCVFALWMVATALWSIDQASSLQVIPTYLGLFVLYAVVTMMPISTVQFRMLLLLTLVGGVLAAAYGVHAFYGNPALLQQTPLDNRRLVITVGDSHIDPNHFSNALLFPACIAAMWALRARGFVQLAVCVAALALMVVAVLLSGSREGFVALVLIGVYYALRSRYRFRLTLALGAAVLAATTVQTSMFVRLATAFQTGGSGRTSVWSVALEAAKHRPIQGYGIGAFQAAYDLFYLNIYQPYTNGWDSPAHNIVVHYLVEMGIVGLALIAMFFWSQFRSLRVVESGDELYDYRILMEAALLAIAFVSLNIDLFWYKYAWLVFFMVALLRNAALARQASAPILPASSAMMPARSGYFSNRLLPDSPSSRSSFS